MALKYELPALRYKSFEDYTGSSYDKGHLRPSGDRTGNDTDNSATFLMTNMIPQSPANNREVWRELEEYSRELVEQYIELKLALSKRLKQLRLSKQLSQQALAYRIKSSQSRVAKMEAGDPSVSLDLLVRALLSTGATTQELAEAIAPGQ